VLVLVVSKHRRHAANRTIRCGRSSFPRRQHFVIPCGFHRSVYLVSLWLPVV